MFNETGNLSLYLGIFFIVISFIGIIFIYKVLKKGELEKDKIDKLVEIGKWFIASVAIVLSTSIINDGFREREQDIKELQFFDKYTDMVGSSKGLERTWLTCEFFSTVSSKGNLKEGWDRYLEILKPKYEEYKRNKKIIAQNKNSDSLNPKKEQDALAAKMKNKELDDLYSPKEKDYSSALYWEKEGFDNLLKKNLSKAITSFHNSEKAYNSYHQVYEIYRYLKNKQPKSDREWIEVYSKILNDYSWGMPKVFRIEITDRINN